MPGSTTTGDDNALDLPQLVVLQIKAVKAGYPILEIEPTSHGVAQSGGLFVNFLLHEMVVASLLDLIERPRNFFHRRRDFDILDSGYVE